MSRSVSCKHPSGRTQLAAAKLFARFCIVCGYEEEDSLKNLNSVLLCLIKKHYNNDNEILIKHKPLAYTRIPELGALYRKKKRERKKARIVEQE